MIKKDKEHIRQIGNKYQKVNSNLIISIITLNINGLNVPSK